MRGLKKLWRDTAGTEATFGEIFVMAIIQSILIVLATAASWAYLIFLFPREPRLVVMGVFGCTHKTVAAGIPLLGAMFGGDPRLGIYTLPLLVWHPIQLLFGSLLVPHLAHWADFTEARLKGEAPVASSGAAAESPIV